MRESPSIAWRRRAQALLAWYRANRRDLPWRRTSDPYAIWVSEIMLQQTRVAAAIPYYERFLARLPDVGALARARLTTLLSLWSGLGYYRRARQMHAAAGVLAREGFPRTVEGWRALPGVGEYTAAAVASIAFGVPAAAVDGNVERVISRLAALRDEPRRVREIARDWLPPDAPGDFNQAVMELGATLCTPRAPRCLLCPLQEGCLGRSKPEEYPVRRRRARAVEERRAVACAIRGGRVMLIRRDSPGLLEGMWDLPEAEPEGPALAVVRHSILNRRLVLSVHGGRPLGEGKWFTPRRAAALPLAAAARKCLERLGFLNDK